MYLWGIRLWVSFFFGMRDLKGRPRSQTEVKNSPVDCFLARGKVRFFPDAVRRTVDRKKTEPKKAFMPSI